MQAPSTHARDPWIGRKIAGRYEVVERIGSGATSLVYRALQFPLRRDVAVKILVPSPTARERSIRRFVNEAQVLSRLQHPNMLHLVDFNRTDDDELYMVTDYVPDGTLRDLIKGQRVTPAAAVEIARQLASALAEAHSHGVIHRDLKPENVLLKRISGGDLNVQLADFGLAKQTVPFHDGPVTDVTKPRTRLGTPGYMSPEAAFHQPVDPAADLYGLGAIVYEMLTGHPVFVADSNEDLYFEHRYTDPPPFSETAPGVVFEPRLEELVLHLLAKHASERPSSAEAVVRELDAIRHDMTPADATTVPAGPRPERPVAIVEPLPTSWRQRHQLVTGALVGAAFTIATALLVF